MTDQPFGPLNLLPPSKFCVRASDSVFHKREHEVIAGNIMLILSRTGDTWRRLPWEEYVAERMKDKETDSSHFTEAERPFFDAVIGYTLSAETAVLFCPEWNKVAAIARDAVLDKSE